MKTQALAWALVNAAVVLPAGVVSILAAVRKAVAVLRVLLLNSCLPPAAIMKWRRVKSATARAFLNVRKVRSVANATAWIPIFAAIQF